MRIPARGWPWTRSIRYDVNAAPVWREVNERLRVLANMNVLVAVVTSNKGASARLLIGARAGRYRLIVSPLVLDKLTTVLTRPKLQSYRTLSVGKFDA